MPASQVRPASAGTGGAGGFGAACAAECVAKRAASEREASWEKEVTSQASFIKPIAYRPNMTT
ncbi:hypothetical protein PsB1_2004 [Candidatus Phycosocius spiralis]|uniref:Uncharacterized protein n=1 Tax=Candidatus Phycosocius spiralis TaxID=2815099 RepID=A0ABQ4PY63_9PROT|nr:hypothetical protein PsB1_2004 [Candidatus Phycosocius spiralis]